MGITILATSALAVPFGISLAHIKNTREFKRMGMTSKDLRALYLFYFFGKGQPPRPR